MGVRLAIILAALGTSACQSTSGTDAGRDAGPDATVDGGSDGGQPDAGPLPTFTARLVNDVPGHPGVHVCMWSAVGGTIVGPGAFLTGATGPIPFRGVSPYLRLDFFLAIDQVDFLVALYVPSATGCPSDPRVPGAPPAIFLGEIGSDEVDVDATYTVIASGLASGTLGAADGALPSVCGATFSESCPESTAVALHVIEDDSSAPGAGMARVRVSNQIPNSGPGFHVCYDPGLVPGPTFATDGNCIDTTPAGDQSAIAMSVAYGSVTAYVERAPILPTGSPAPGVGGGLYLIPVSIPICPGLTMPARCYPIFAAWPVPQASDNIRPNLAAGDVSTIFLSGAIGQPPNADPTMDFSAKFFLWQDNLAPGP